MALAVNNTGTNNTALGSGALNPNTTGSNNVAIGYQFGCSIKYTWQAIA
jgi:hypothetical protein